MCRSHCRLRKKQHTTTPTPTPLMLTGPNNMQNDPKLGDNTRQRPSETSNFQGFVSVGLRS